MDMLTSEELPRGIHIDWGQIRNVPSVEAIHYDEGGTINVHHGQVPPKVETAVVLRAAGVLTPAVTNLLDTQASYLTEVALNAHNLPKVEGMYYPRVPMLVARLCLRRGILEIKDPVASPEPSELYTDILSFLGEGKDWADIRAAYGLNRQAATQILKNYPGHTDNERLNLNSLLLRAYGSGNLDPETVVAEQPFPKPQLPLEPPRIGRPPVHTAEHKPLTIWEKRRLKTPETLQPFSDNDKLIHINKESPGEYTVSGIEACGAVLKMNQRDVITNWAGEQVKLEFKDKLAMALFALGATSEEVGTYAMNVNQLSELRKRLGVRLHGRYGLIETTFLTCRELLKPTHQPVFSEGDPNFHLLSEYLSLENKKTVNSKASHRLRKQIYAEMEYYMGEDRPAWSSVNLMILTGYASKRIPAGMLHWDNRD